MAVRRVGWLDWLSFLLSCGKFHIHAPFGAGAVVDTRFDLVILTRNVKPFLQLSSVIGYQFKFNGFKFNGQGVQQLLPRC